MIARTLTAAAALMLPIAAAAQTPNANWTGGYGGFVGTLGIMSADPADHWCYVACDSASMATWGGAAGVTLGYNMQQGNFVFGVEGDINAGKFDNYEFHEGSSYRSSMGAKWGAHGTLRGRAGLAVDNTMFFVTGGIAAVRASYRQDYVSAEFADNRGFMPLTKTQVGLAAGAGVEHAISPRMSVKLEYLYIGLPSVNGGNYYLDIDDPASIREDSRITYRSDAHLFRFGVNYRF